MPRPKQVTDEQISLAARHVFREVGVNAPVSLVAKALGVTPAALFHRTGSREQLFIMALRPSRPEQFKLLKVMSDGPVDGTPVQLQLEEILTRLSAHLAVVSPNVFMMFAAGMYRHRGTKANLPLRTRRHLAAWLERARRRGGWRFRNAVVLAEALVGALEGRHLYGYLHGRHFSVPGERRFVRALLAELLGPHRSRAVAR
jgi:AcrR family transcriptional regulator